MKKLFSSLSAALLIITAANAQSIPTLQSEISVDNQKIKSLVQDRRENRKEIKKLSGPDISSLSKQAFAVDFADAENVGWMRLDSYDEADFMKDGKAMSAFYDGKGKLVGTTQNKPFSDIPQRAQSDIARFFKGYTPVDVILYDDNEDNDTDMMLYGMQLQNRDNYFVEMASDTKKIVLEVSPNGEVGYVARLR